MSSCLQRADLPDHQQCAGDQGSRFGVTYKMRKLLIAVEEQLHTLDPRLIGLMHKTPAHSGGSARHGILFWSDICNGLGVEI
jgi:hypothetical protein